MNTASWLVAAIVGSALAMQGASALAQGPQQSRYGAVYGLPRDFDKRPLRLVTVCRLVEKKGVAFALRAVAALKAAKPDLDWRYSIIGDGPLLHALRLQAAELGVAERVEFHGALPHAVVTQQLAQAHVFLLPKVGGKVPIVCSVRGRARG